MDYWIDTVEVSKDRAVSFIIEHRTCRENIELFRTCYPLLTLRSIGHG